MRSLPNYYFQIIFHPLSTEFPASNDALIFPVLSRAMQIIEQPAEKLACGIFWLQGLSL
jgi:hypothetical protein